MKPVLKTKCAELKSPCSCPLYHIVHFSQLKKQYCLAKVVFYSIFNLLGLAQKIIVLSHFSLSGLRLIKHSTLQPKPKKSYVKGSLSLHALQGEVLEELPLFFSRKYIFLLFFLIMSSFLWPIDPISHFVSLSLTQFLKIAKYFEDTHLIKTFYYINLIYMVST